MLDPSPHPGPQHAYVGHDGRDAAAMVVSGVPLAQEMEQIVDGPEKVQAVLLPLGGCDVPSGIASVGICSQQDKRGLDDLVQCTNLPARRSASLMRFRGKQKGGNFDKKIRYPVRREVALRMQRCKRRFVAKAIPQEGVSPSNCHLAWSLKKYETDRDTKCQNCGISEKLTPAMRRGPAGPKSLCNARGLMRENKEMLKITDAKYKDSDSEFRSPESTTRTTVPSAMPDEIIPLSGNPYFTSIVVMTQLSPPFSLVIPKSFYQYLPSTLVTVVFSYRNRSWEMRYSGNISLRRINSGWKDFAIDNKLKIGDGCVFELMDRKTLKFRVQILSAQIPSIFVDADGANCNGQSSNTPVIID